MRLNDLVISAFGPFARQESIDFKAFGRHPLLLINGPTGAGKTTILDAICFALYGETTAGSGDRQIVDMRCQFSTAEDLTEVTLGFTIGEAEYRIRRVPEQRRLKLRGDGFTEQKGEAQLWHVRSDGATEVLVARKTTEATQRIEQITGLTAAQFRQVMVLPQGKFRDILLAGSKEREQLFEQIFRTSVYSGIQQQIRERARASELKLRELTGKRKTLLDSVDQESEAGLEIAIAGLVPERENAEVRAETARVMREHCERSLQAGAQLNEAIGKLVDVRRQLEAVRAGEPAHRLEERARDLAEKALVIDLAWQDLLTRRSELEAAQRGLTQAREALAEANTHALVAEAELAGGEALSQPIDDARQRLAQLRAMEDAVGKLDGLRGAMELARASSAGATVECDQALARVAVMKTELAEVDALIGDIRARLEQGEDQGERLEQAVNLVRERTQHMQLGAELIQVTAALQSARQEHSASATELTALQAERVTLDSAWRSEQASLLAAMLEPGQPCKVCGSVNHPHPAVYADGAVSVEALQTNQERLDATLRVLSAKSGRVVELSTQIELKAAQIESLRQRLGAAADESLTQLKARHQALERQRKEREADRKSLGTMEARRGVLTTELADAVEAHLLAERARVAAMQEMVRAETAYQTASEQVPESLHRSSALADAIAGERGQLTAMEARRSAARSAYASAREQLASATARADADHRAAEESAGRLALAIEAWSARRLGAGFSDDGAFLAARLDTLALDNLRSKIAQFEERKRQLQEHEARLTQETGERSPADLVALERARAEAVIHETLSRQHVGELIAKLDALNGIRASLQATAVELEREDQLYGWVGRLDELVHGNNAQRITLQTYVLSVLLDEVLELASERLMAMSKGRYSVHRREDVTDRRARTGLDLDVGDAYTGQMRPVSTLSGGESFMAALSLALGLSDVIQRHSGGIYLETLFIDEGFGSLDSEALDLAIRMLVELRSSGRMVGVISHVEELKRTITQQIKVLPVGGGSMIVSA